MIVERYLKKKNHTFILFYNLFIFLHLFSFSFLLMFIIFNNMYKKGLKQFEFGYKKDALQVEGGGHYIKYYTCSRAIGANLLITQTLVKSLRKKKKKYKIYI